jgi:hypothetical protein
VWLVLRYTFQSRIMLMRLQDGGGGNDAVPSLTIASFVRQKKAKEDATFCFIKDGFFFALLCLTSPAHFPMAKKNLKHWLRLHAISHSYSPDIFEFYGFLPLRCQDKNQRIYWHVFSRFFVVISSRGYKQVMQELVSFHPNLEFYSRGSVSEIFHYPFLKGAMSQGFRPSAFFHQKIPRENMFVFEREFVVHC